MFKITKKMPAIRAFFKINLEYNHVNCWHESKTMKKVRLLILKCPQKAHQRGK